MHSHNNNSREKNIKVAAMLNIAFTAIELVGGLWTNSLAILSNALHDFGDSITLVISLIAEKKAKQPPDAKRTYGYQRISLFAAQFAGVVLIGGSIFIISEAIPRLLNPEQINAGGMIWLAVIGIIANGIGMLRLKKGKSQNEKILSWHFLEDVLSWVAILIGGVIMYFWENEIIDPIMTIGFTLFVLWGATRNLKATMNIFMQGVPDSINIDKIREELLQVQRIKNVHDLHIWSLDGETNIFSGHIIVEDEAFKKPNDTKKRIKDILAKHNIEHSTIELETEDFCSGAECEINGRK
jgi:cobalt-zinc-cadmium efflux system protein